MNNAHLATSLPHPTKRRHIDAVAHRQIRAAFRSSIRTRSAGAKRRSPAARTPSKAHHFFSSTLFRRVSTIAGKRGVVLLDGRFTADLYLRDAHGRLHVVGLTSERNAIDAAGDATIIERELRGVLPNHVARVSIHLYSLTSGRRFQFDRDIDSNPGAATRLAQSA